MARSIVKKWIFGLCGLFVLAFCPQNGLSAETAIKGKSPDFENNSSLRKYFSYSEKKFSAHFGDNRNGPPYEIEMKMKNSSPLF